MDALAFSLHRAVGERWPKTTADAPSPYILSFVAALAAAAAAAATAAAVFRTVILVAMHCTVLQRHASVGLGFILPALILSALLRAITV